MDSAKFLGDGSLTSFYGIKVGSNVELADAVFDGPTDFTRADIKGELTLDRAAFGSLASFNLMSIGSYLWMREGTVFHGPADFTGTSIAGKVLHCLASGKAAGAVKDHVILPLRHLCRPSPVK